MIGSADRAALEVAIRRHGLGRVVTPLLAGARLAAVLEPTPRGSTRTRLGGAPLLPAGMDWPLRQGVPLGFLGQIDLGEAPLAALSPPLPSAGLLALFFDVVHRPGGYAPWHQGLVRVLHLEEPALAPRPLHAKLPPEARFSEIPRSPSLRWTLPPAESLLIELLRLTTRERDQYLELLESLAGDLLDRPYHQLLGHPELVEGDQALECELVRAGFETSDGAAEHHPAAAGLRRSAAAWRLLLQLDLGELSSAPGLLYVWIREEDLAARRFDAAWALLQR